MLTDEQTAALRADVLPRIAAHGLAAARTYEVEDNEGRALLAYATALRAAADLVDGALSGCKSALLDSDIPPALIAEAYGVAEGTAERWRRDARKSGQPSALSIGGQS